MSKLIYSTGQKFNKLEILKQVEQSKCGKSQWLCRCDCGNEKIIRGDHLKSGHTKSCGCLASKHGHYKNGEKAKIYQVWLNMIDRCTNPSNNYYNDYGGRGIIVCEEWRKFSNFSEDMCEVPAGLQIDRIDNDKGYYKSNCRWATTKQQSRNRRSNHRITHDGETHILVVWADKVGITADTIRMRLKRGWSTKRALTTKV